MKTLCLKISSLCLTGRDLLGLQATEMVENEINRLKTRIVDQKTGRNHSDDFLLVF